MRNCILLIFWLASSANAWSQGEFAFSNHNRDVAIDAPVFDTDCRTRLEGPAFLWQVYGGLSPDNLQPLGDIAPFLTGTAAGYINTRGYAMPGAVVYGTIVHTQLRAWEAASGATFEAAVAAGGKYGFSNIVPITATFGSVHPFYPVGLHIFCLMPPLGQEPRIIISTALSSNVQLHVIKGPDWTVILQASTDLRVWLPLATNMLSDTVWIVEQPKSSAQRFYRALRQNPQKPSSP